jgi:hypothetical protein
VTVPSDGAADPCLPEKMDAGLDNEDIFDNSTFRNTASKASSKRKADDASSRVGGASATKRKRKADLLLGEAPRDIVLLGVPALERLIFENGIDSQAV